MENGERELTDNFSIKKERKRAEKNRKQNTKVSTVRIARKSKIENAPKYHKNYIIIITIL